MLAKDLISDEVMPLKTSDPASIALGWMDDLRVSHLPIVNNEKFLGLVSDTDIYDVNTPEEPLGNHSLSLIRPYVLCHQHLYEVLRVVASQHLTLVPVLDEKGNYKGCITLVRIAQTLADMASLQQPGGVLVLEVNNHDYALSEIARIVESNDAKVLSSYITSHPDSTRLEVTIKVNKIDLSPIIQTFNRYNYNIIASYSEESLFGDLINDRFESLMNYLNI